MTRYRVRIDLCQINLRWRVCYASSPGAAYAYFMGTGWSGGLGHLQSWQEGKWRHHWPTSSEEASDFGEAEA